MKLGTFRHILRYSKTWLAPSWNLQLPLYLLLLKPQTALNPRPTRFIGKGPRPRFENEKSFIAMKCPLGQGSRTNKYKKTLAWSFYTSQKAFMRDIISLIYITNISTNRPQRQPCPPFFGSRSTARIYEQTPLWLAASESGTRLTSRSISWYIEKIIRKARMRNSRTR